MDKGSRIVWIIFILAFVILLLVVVGSVLFFLYFYPG